MNQAIIGLPELLEPNQAQEHIILGVQIGPGPAPDILENEEHIVHEAEIGPDILEIQELSPPDSNLSPSSDSSVGGGASNQPSSVGGGASNQPSASNSNRSSSSSSEDEAVGGFQWIYARTVFRSVKIREIHMKCNWSSCNVYKVLSNRVDDAGASCSKFDKEIREEPHRHEVSS